MNRYVSTFGAALVASLMAISTWDAAAAAPLAGEEQTARSSIELVQYHDNRRPQIRRDRDRHHMDDHRDRRDRRGYWNGHRGYREYRKGYRRHSDGFYYPLTVFRLNIR